MHVCHESMWLCIQAVVSAQCTRELLQLQGRKQSVAWAAVETPAAAKTDRAKPLLGATYRDTYGGVLFADVVSPCGERFSSMISGRKYYESLHVPTSCSFAASTSEEFVRWFRKNRAHRARESGVVQTVESRYFRACMFLQSLIAVIHG